MFPHFHLLRRCVGPVLRFLLRCAGRVGPVATGKNNGCLPHRISRCIRTSSRNWRRRRLFSLLSEGSFAPRSKRLISPTRVRHAEGHELQAAPPPKCCVRAWWIAVPARDGEMASQKRLLRDPISATEEEGDVPASMAELTAVHHRSARVVVVVGRPARYPVGARVPTVGAISRRRALPESSGLFPLSDAPLSSKCHPQKYASRESQSLRTDPPRLYPRAADRARLQR